MSDFTVGVAFGVLYREVKHLADPEYRKGALAWVKSNRSNYASFLWVCDQLSLDPEIARTKLMTRRVADLDALLDTFAEQIRAESG